ncbi:alpha/beta hydrolase [Peterkaempfera bronchialis]|uniref:Esterase n=1 Tax=Peterkaempfera bronchialis TaxID=2126346 RepID=A0A345T1Y1_9ACTN|nr:alpha/beta hydrolase-fold protein [Peterkaempfera bronchialis]AXI79986.1 esterase [Peterkaempfera bronchialis]
MDLTSGAFFALIVAVLVVLTVLVLALWNRIPGPKAVRHGGRLGLLLLNQAVAVLVALVWLNNTYAFYESWDDLLGNNGNQVALGPDGATPKVGAAALGGLQPKGTRSALSFDPYKRDVLISTAVGPSSRLRGELYVWLPPQYHEAAYQDKAFPVIELLPGQPGSPRTWFGALDVDRKLSGLIASQQTHPFILVAVTMNYTGIKDTGCTNIPNGPQADTWLAKDVPWLIKHSLRAAPDARHWAVMGYSAGGYCAVNLIVKHPSVFHSAVSLSGYNTPDSPFVVHNPALRAANSPVLRLRRMAAQPDIALLLAGSLQDGRTVADARSLLAELSRPAHGTTLTVAHGGHNTAVWAAMLPTALEWLTKNTAGPVHTARGIRAVPPPHRHPSRKEEVHAATAAPSTAARR